MHKAEEGCNKVIEIELEFLIDGFNNKDYFRRGFEFKCNKKATLFEILPVEQSEGSRIYFSLFRSRLILVWNNTEYVTIRHDSNYR